MNIAIVTGGAQGIGRKIANTYANNGHNVIVLDIQQTTFDNDNIECIQVDLADSNQIEQAFAQIASKYGKAHILINNAGITKFSCDIFDITLEQFDNVIDVNLRGTYLCCRQFIKLNKGENYGRIVNISSTRYHQNEANWEAYGASKGAIVSLTNTLCVSLSDTPITVNAISPGWIQTTDYDKLTAEDHSQHPSGRVGKCSDIARACMYLSDPDNDFINGSNIIIDGGMTKRMIYLT